jgi:hypothetical protein
MGPTVIKKIPDQVINEQAAYGPFNLNDYIQGFEGSSTLRFKAALTNGEALPKGLICTADGLLMGIPATATQGNHEIKVTAENDAGAVETTFVLTVKPSLVIGAETQYINELKTQVWQALEQKLPIPDIAGLYDQPISIFEIYYLLERWGVLKIWDAFNLDPAEGKTLLTLEGASEHYHVYDRGSCLVGVPKDLFSHERTIEDGLKTARAMAREVYRREWTIELVGISKLTRAAWIELRRIGELQGKFIDVINFNPTLQDVKIYESQVLESQIQGRME